MLNSPRTTSEADDFGSRLNSAEEDGESSALVEDGRFVQEVVFSEMVVL